MAAPTASTQYQYSKLEPDQIRLLRVLSTDDIIHCRLERVSLHKAPTYHAFSYVWGNQKRDFEILLSDETSEGSFSVTPHLAVGLRQVGRFLSTDEYRNDFVWIDAICIDQGDLTEKETQIPLMRNIYTNAFMVCIWLGDSSREALISMAILSYVECHSKLYEARETVQDAAGLTEELENNLAGLGVHSEDLQGLLNVINELMRHPSTNNDINDRMALQGRLESLSSGQHILKPDHPLWSTLLTFFNHPWFSRIWTLQEIYLAREAHVFCGRLTIAWSRYNEFRSLLLDTRCPGFVYSGKSAKKARFSSVLSYLVETKILNRDRNWGDLSTLLMGSGGRHAFIDKDYIYGTLGILEDSTRQKIPIDYSPSTSTAKVYAEATRLACESYKDPSSYWNLLLSVHRKRPKKVEQLPSWCPDFSNAKLDDDFRDTTGRPVISDSVYEKHKLFTGMEFPTGTDTMVIRGFRLDRVEEVVPAPDVLGFTDIYHMVDLDMGLDDTMFCKAFGAEQMQWLRNMRSTFTALRNDNANSEGCPLKFLFYGFGDEVINAIKYTLPILEGVCNTAMAFGHTSVPGAFASLGISGAELEMLLQCATLVLLHQCGRHIFRTSSGRLGYAPLPVSRGDNICFIPGGQLLHVLSHDCTKHVALAHVEGFMDEDLLKVVATDRSQWQDFHLV